MEMSSGKLRNRLHWAHESVWDYPRPPKVEDAARHVRVVFNGVTIANTHRALRVLENGHPPVYYIPLENVKMQYLVRTTHTTQCEFKGEAAYYSVVVGDKTAENSAWCYPSPTPGYAELKGFIAFYPSKMDGCYVDEERVLPEPGDFYGGWITKEIVGPFKSQGGPEH